MKHRLPNHSERVRVRARINNRTYPDNPLRLPYNNAGSLIALPDLRGKRSDD